MTSKAASRERAAAVIADYLDAFAAANGPAGQPPSVIYERGWFEFRQGSSLRWDCKRRAEVEAMTARLRARAAEAPTPIHPDTKGATDAA